MYGKIKVLVCLVVVLLVSSVIPVNAMAQESEDNSEDTSQQTVVNYTVYSPPYNGGIGWKETYGNAKATWATNSSTGYIGCTVDGSGFNLGEGNAGAVQEIKVAVGRPKILTVDAIIDFMAGDIGDYLGNISKIWGYFDNFYYSSVVDPWLEWPEVLLVLTQIGEFIAALYGMDVPTTPSSVIGIIATAGLSLLEFAQLAGGQYSTTHVHFNFLAHPSDDNFIRVGLQSKAFYTGEAFAAGYVENITVYGIAPPPTPTISVVGDEPRDTDTPYTFRVMSEDPNNDPVKYVIDWGDGNITTTGYNETGEPAVEVTHSYSRTISPYPYQVKAKAIDCDGMESDWSDSLPVYIVNHRPKITSLYVCWPDENGVDIPKDKVRRYLNYYYEIQSWDADINTQTIKYFMKFSDEDIFHESDNISSLWYGFYHRFSSLGYYNVTAWCMDSVGVKSLYKIFTIHVINTLPSTPSNPSPTTGATIYVSSSINPDSTTVKSNPTQVNLQTAYLDPQAAQTTYSLNQDAVQVESADAESSTTTTSASSNIAEPVASTSQELESSSATTGSISSQPTLNGIDLRWSGGDPDGDNVTYKIYFGTSSPSSLIGTTENTCSYHYSGTLTAGNTYYWKVVATDEYGGVAEGPVWHFTVSNDNNNDNNNSSDTQQTNNAISQPIEEYQTLI